MRQQKPKAPLDYEFILTDQFIQFVSIPCFSMSMRHSM